MANGFTTMYLHFYCFSPKKKKKVFTFLKLKWWEYIDVKGYSYALMKWALLAIPKET